MNKSYTVLYQKVQLLKRSIKQLKHTENKKRKNSLVLRIQRLFRQLQKYDKFAKLKPAIVGAMMAVGFTGINAQTTIEFAEPVANPFGFTPTQYLILPSTGDFDNDGDYDMLNGGLNFPAYGLNESFSYFENTGTPENANFGSSIAAPFGLSSDYFLQFSTNADLDNDGDLDILVGGYIQYGTTEGQISFYYYENKGTPESPEFPDRLQNPFNLRLPQNTLSSYPSLVDIDDDGDLDAFSTILTRDQVIDVFFFENIGDAENPEFGNPVPGADFGVNQNLFLTIDFTDLDVDGDQDMLIGGFNSGNVFYYENIGTAKEMYFADPVVDPFGLGPRYVFSVVNYVDMDADGDQDLFVGDLNEVVYFENISKIKPTPLESNIFMEEDSSYVFVSDDFKFIEGISDTITGVVIEQLPENGQLLFDGADVAVSEIIDIALIDQFVYQPNENVNGEKIDYFTFNLISEVGTSESSDTMFINISPVNDVPAFVLEESEVTTCSYTGEVVINISDIDLGGEENETAEFTVSSDNNAIENVSVAYNEADTTAVLSFNPIGGESGDGAVTIALSDGTDVLNQEVAVTIEACLGVNSLSLDNNLQAFPNPGKEMVRLHWNNESVANFANIKIYDLSGRLVQETKYNNGLDVSGLNAGQYFVATEIAGQWLMTKLSIL